ncbi:MAG: S66 peptidase family protein [Bacteroidales bacterium]
MITPEKLRKGDTIAIVGPAGKIDRSKIRIAKNKLQSWGLNVVEGNHLFDNEFQYAANDEKRLQDFQMMLDDPKIKAILCARGGYGTVRIIDRIDFTGFRKNPKWIIGFSDITVIHSHIQLNLATETIHGCMAGGFDLRKNDRQSSETLKKALFDEMLTYKINHQYLSRKGVCQGELTGGNLTILCSLIGSASDVDTDGKVLFIEEIGEHHYRIDRMMQTLRRAGKLSQIAGLIVGGLTEIPDKAVHFGKTAFELVDEVIQNYNFPVCYGFPSGHLKDNRALILGRKVKLSIGHDTCLDFFPVDESA